MAGSTVTFARGGVTVTLPAPSSGKTPRLRQRQTLQRAQGGAVRVHNSGVATFEVELRLEGLALAQMDALVSFVMDQTQGMLETFTYTDESGIARTARFLSPELRFVEIAWDVYDVTLLLEVDAMGR